MTLIPEKSDVANIDIERDIRSAAIDAARGISTGITLLLYIDRPEVVRADMPDLCRRIGIERAAFGHIELYVADIGNRARIVANVSSLPVAVKQSA